MKFKQLLLLFYLFLSVNFNLFSQVGSVDQTFDAGLSSDFGIRRTVVQSDGKIIAVGEFNTFNGENKQGIVRLNPDGSIDNTFQIGNGAESGYVNSVAIQSDGKILIGGTFQSFNGNATSYFARLNQDGTIDGTFNGGAGANGNVSTIDFFSDESILIAGNFTSYNSIPTPQRVARILQNGNLDSTFDAGQGSNNGSVTHALVFEDNVYLSGFSSWLFNGSNVPHVIKLDQYGYLDVNFDLGGAGPAGGSVHFMKVQANGNILLGGDFSSYNGDNNINSLVSIYSNGNFDGDFQTPSNGFVVPVSALEILGDGRIIVGGSFTNFNGVNCSGIVRLEDNGVLDSSFDSGSTSTIINSIVSEQDGSKIIVAGSFSNLGGKKNIARIINECSESFSYLTETACGSYDFGGITYYSSGVYYDIIPNAMGCDSIIELTLTILDNPITTIDGNMNTFCEGENVTLTAYGDPATYSWSDGIVNGDPFLPVGTGQIDYTLTVTGSNGCVVVENPYIYVNPLPNVTANASSLSVCEGGQTTLYGSGADSYSWDNGITDGFSFEPLFTSIFTVTGTDFNGCQNTDEIQIVVNSLPNVSAGPDLTVCENQTVTLSGSGADTYVWSDFVFDGTTFSPPVGFNTYTVTGTDLNGCQKTDQVNVTVYALPLVEAGADVTLCENDETTLSASGADSYVWDFGVIDGVSFVPTISDWYYVVGTDLNGCQGTDYLFVTINSLPAVVGNATQNVICENTEITLTGSGADSYTWNNGVVNLIPFTPLASSSYVVEGTDVNGCINRDTIFVTVNSLPTVDAGPDMTVCENESVTLFGSGADTYVWDDGVIDGLPFTPFVGLTTFTVTGTDINGCQNTDQVNITVHALPLVEAGADVTLCENDETTLSASGADSYVWDFGVIDGVSFVPTISDWYYVVGTDLNGCQGTDYLFVTINSLPAVVGNATQNVICENTEITLTGSGADSYTWNNGVVNLIPFTPLASSSYVVEGTDVNGCINRDTIFVTVNSLPTVDAGPDMTVCENESVTLFGSGADTYVWDDGVIDGLPFTPFVGFTTFRLTGTDLNGCQNTDSVNVTVHALPLVEAGADVTLCENDETTLSASGADSYVWDFGVIDGVSFVPTISDWYYVVGTDLNGCQGTDYLFVTINSLPAVVGNATQNVICENTEITLTGSGADSYTWNNGVVNLIPFTPLASSSYVVEGTDVNGCINRDTIFVTVNSLPTVDAGPDMTVCENESVTLFGSGADTYVWDDGVIDGLPFTPFVGFTTFRLTGTDLNGCQNTDSVNVTVHALPLVEAGADVTLCENDETTLSASGADSYVWDFGVIDGVSFVPTISDWYYVVGTDLNGCQGTDYLFVTINSLPAVVGNATQNVICENTEITLTGSGADSYTWNNGVVNLIPFTPLASSSYVVEGTDVNGCINRDTIFVTVNSLPTVDAGADVSICFGDEMTLSGSGADSYVWDGGVIDGLPFTPTFSSNYTLTGTDLNGCQNVDEVFVTVNFAPGITSNSPIEICENDVANISLSTGAVIIKWFDAEVAGNLVFEGRNFSPSLNTSTTYFVEASDGICTSARIPVDIIVNPRPQVLISSTNTDCGTANGTATAVISQGTAPFNHYWSSGDQNVLAVSNLSAGIYYFNVEDAKSCKAIAQAEIIPPNITIDGTVTNISCFNGNNGSISSTINGISENFTYLWSNGYSTPDISNLLAGTYELTVRTESGCILSKTFIVSQAPKLEVEVSQIQPSCGNSDGELSVTSISGGTPNYNYNWSSGGSTNTINNIPFGAYTLTITDANSCVNDYVYYVSENNAAGIFGTVIPASCNTANGSIDALLIPQIGDVVTSISWSNGATTEDIFDLANGNYVCTATTSNSCNSIRGWNLINQKPMNQEICIVSVDSTTTTNLVVWEKAQLSGVSHYNIYRETNTADEYLLIDTVQYTNLSVFNDVVASPSSRSWRYKISAVDLCGNESDLSFPHKTLHLNTFDIGNDQMKITWDNYEGNSFSSFILWRYTDADGWIDITTLPTTTLNYTDNISSLTPGLDYMVELSLDEPCTATIWRAQDFNHSRSNKERGIFNPGEGTGDYSNNSLAEFNKNGIILNVYPNPFDETFYFEFEGTNSMNVHVVDLNGKILMENVFSEGIHQINMSNLEKGVYFLKTQKDNLSYTIKLVKN
jgi:uncharacterized delta-60 repeat protein